MAFTATLTGTGRNCNITSGSNSMVVSSATDIVVGATIQGTGIPTGTRVGTISGTTVTMVTATGTPSNATVTNATASLIFSSVWGSILTVSLSASGDVATMQNIYNAGFGVMSDNIAQKNIFFAGALGIEWKNIVAGAIFDFQNWSIEFGSKGYWGWDQSTILGELRGGYLVNGTQFIKSAGPTFYANNYKNATAGGSNMFIGTATGTVTGTFRMNNLRVVEQNGSNNSPFFGCGRMNCIVDDPIFDYTNDVAGANAGLGVSFGYIKNPTAVKVNLVIIDPNAPNIGTITGLKYVGLYNQSPHHKLSIPNGSTLDEYEPQVLSTQLLAGFANNSTETYSNIKVSSAGWGLNDLKTKYQRYGGPNEIRFPRRVSLEFNDSSANNLTGVTLYIRSGATSLVNAVQAGDYSENTQALILNWTGSLAFYRVANTITDTISQIAQIRKYGYTEQSTSYSLNLASYSQPFFMLTDNSLSGISEATASAITTAGINWTTKTITPTANLTYDQINACIAWELAQTANSAQVDPRTIVGSNLTLATGWTLIVNNGITISTGTNITYWYTPTITLNGTGSITAVYATTAGTSTVLQLNTSSAGYSLCLYTTGGTTKYFQSGLASGSYYVYLSPSEAGTYKLAGEKYGYKRTEDTLSLTGGNVWYNFTDQEDAGISVTNSATVGAYTTIENLDKFYDYTAYIRLQESYIKLGQIATRSGTSIEIGTFNLVVNHNHTPVESITSGTITIKSSILANGTKYTNIIAIPPATVSAHTNEIITANIEDANGNSSVEILGGDGTFELWKITTATATADYATGTKLTSPTIGNVKYRFIGITGYDIVGVDINSNVRRRTSMVKGVYTQSFYVGDQIQLAQAPEVSEINIKVSLLQNDITEIKGDGFISEDNSLVAITNNTPSIDPASVWEYENRTLTQGIGGGGVNLSGVTGSISNLSKKMEEEHKKTRELIISENNDTNSHIELAKEETIDTIEAIEMPEIPEADLSKITDSLGTLKMTLTKLSQFVRSEAEKEKNEEKKKISEEYESKLSEMVDKIEKMEDAYEELDLSIGDKEKLIEKMEETAQEIIDELEKEKENAKSMAKKDIISSLSE